MRKHNRYDLVKELFDLGVLKTFREIIKYLKKTPVAKRLGRERGRFNELIDDPDGLTIHELMVLSKDCNMPLSDIGQSIETQCPIIPHPNPEKILTYKILNNRIKGERITTLKGLFDIMGPELTKELGRKEETIKRYLDHVEKFQVKDLRILATLCEVSLVTIFKLLEAQYVIQMNKNTE